MAGLQTAVQQVQSYGRGPDTMLAHVSPQEAKLVDYLQGGTRTNPMTGLPEYGLFGDILKAVARAAGAIGGFMLGGPAGAALGAGAATKLTGGSWKDALKAGAMGGIGGLGANVLGGAGAGLTTGPAMNATAGTFEGFENAMPSITSAGIGQVAMSTPGIAAGLGALSAPLNSTPSSSGTPAPLPAPNGPNINIVPQQRTYQPYQGDPLHFAEPGSGGAGHVFYTPLLPQPIFQSPTAPPVLPPDQTERGFRKGGRVPRFAMGGPMALAGPQMSSGPRVPAFGIGAADPQAMMMRRAAMMGYMNAAQGGAAHEGPVRGPGTGTSDSISAFLSNGEHVWTKKETDALGGGDNERGQKVMYALRKQALKNPAKVRAVARGLGAV